MRVFEEMCLYSIPRPMYEDMVRQFKKDKMELDCDCLRCRWFTARVLVKRHVPLKEYDNELFIASLKNCVLETGRIPFQ